jgi:DNA-binding CsgD family transcriptional regulator/tetratricopeptide (TPR) repeat protein
MRQPFVGRADLLDALRDRYLKAQCGDGGAVILSGDAGIGKTRAIEQFLETVAAADRYVVATAALDYASSPFAPFVTVIETWLRTRPELFTGHPGLRDAVELILKGDAGTSTPSAAERRRCFDAVAQLFRIAAADAPTTVVIDDLHYADPATIQMLYHVLLATRRSAFLVIASVRPPVITEGRVSPLFRLERLENVTRVNVGPLADDACERLIARAADGRITKEGRQHIHERSEGNPLFAEELVLQALHAGRATGEDIPSTIAQTILERVSSLSQRERDVLIVAAALGRVFEATLLEKIAARDIDEILATIRSAVKLGLVDETSDPHVFRFRHALMREAIYGELLRAERQQIHRRIFAELLRRPPAVENVAALAFHAYSAGDAPNTAYYNELAGDHAAGNQAFESALEFYERALSASDDADPQTTRVCKKLATAYLLAGFPERAAIPVRRGLEQHRRRGETGSVADALLLLADIAGQTGEDELRLQLLGETIGVLADANDAPSLAKRALCAAEIAIAERAVDPAIDGYSALAGSSEIGAPIAIALRNASAQAFLTQRRYQAAARAQAQAVRMAAECGDPEQLAASRFGFGVVLSLSGKVARASVSFAEAAAIARARYATTEGAIALAFSAEMELIRGDVKRARELRDEAMPDARRSDHPLLITMMGRVGIFLGVRTDDATLIQETVSDLDLESLFRNQTAERFFPLSGAFAQFLALEGREEEARSVLERAVRRLSAKRLRSTDWSPCTMLTIAAMGPEAAVPAARRPIDEWFAPYAPAFVNLFDAIVAERFGDAEGAARHAGASIDAFRAYEFKFEEALALSMVGRKLEALAIFDRLGARSFAKRIRDELTPKNRRGRPLHTLTAREREVAALVADGLSNREISDRLFVTEKTVETHLASIFAKLGVRSRTEVAPRLEGEHAGAV